MMTTKQRIVLLLTCAASACAPASEGKEGSVKERSQAVGSSMKPQSTAERGRGRAARDDQERAALVRAEGAARQLGGTLKGRLGEALKATTPAGAASVCADAAPGIAAAVAEETGVRVGRASLRLRSPANAPAPWVEPWLKAHEGVQATAAAPLREIVEDEDGARARVILPIAIEPLCLSCHGEVEGIDREIRAMLAARYPQDAATGYAVGDLRGALWAEAPVRLSPDDR